MSGNDCNLAASRKGDYRVQIVAYSIALLFRLFRQAQSEFNLAAIWKRQEVDTETANLLETIAIAVQNALLAPPPGTSNVGEWTKKETCWERVKEIRISVTHLLDSLSLSKDQFRDAKKEARKQGVEDDGISLQTSLYEFVVAGYWKQLSQWHKLEQYATPDEITLIRNASTERSFLKINSKIVWKRLTDLKDRLEKEGFRA